MFYGSGESVFSAKAKCKKVCFTKVGGSHKSGQGLKTISRSGTS